MGRKDRLHAAGARDEPALVCVGATLAKKSVLESFGKVKAKLTGEAKKKSIYMKLLEKARWIETPLLHYKPATRLDEFFFCRYLRSGLFPCTSAIAAYPFSSLFCVYVFVFVCWFIIWSGCLAFVGQG